MGVDERNKQGSQSLFPLSFMETLISRLSFKNCTSELFFFPFSWLWPEAGFLKHTVDIKNELVLKGTDCQLMSPGFGPIDFVLIYTG